MDSICVREGVATFTIGFGFLTERGRFLLQQSFIITWNVNLDPELSRFVLIYSIYYKFDIPLLLEE